MTVYADEAFLLNGAVDYLLLICAAKLGGGRIARLRLLAAALFGGLYAAAALFDNRYDAKDVKVALGATKTLSGATLKADQFEFVLRDADGNEVARAKNAADGAIAFPELAYSLDQIGGRGKSKTFEYTIEEGAGSEDGVTYDKAVHKVKVVVSDDGASGKLIAEVAYDGAASAPVFENAYTPHTPKDSPKKPGGMPSTGDNSSMLASFVATMGLVALATGLRMSRRKRD